MIHRLRKYENAVMQSKGHAHLYDRYDNLVKDLRALSEWDNELTQAVIGIVQQLLYEAAVTAVTPFYPVYSLRCWLCADNLHALLREKDNSIRPDTLIREIEDLLLEKRVVCYTEEKVWLTYVNSLIHQQRWYEIRTLITHSIVLSDEGQRPRELHREEILHNHLKRAYNLINRYITQTHDRSTLHVWIDACKLKHHQDILYSLVNRNGDIRIIGLLIDSIRLIEELQVL